MVPSVLDYFEPVLREHVDDLIREDVLYVNSRATPARPARLTVPIFDERCFRLDRAVLDGFARELGPQIGDTVGGPQTDAALVTEFQKRGGFDKPVPVLRDGLLDRIMDAALATSAPPG
jgi:hypothetical protein